MMLPSAAPMILTFAAVQARRDRNVAVPAWMFVAGYLLVWAYAGLVVYALLQTGLQTSKDLAHHVPWLGSVAWARLVLGTTLTLAGLYQFTPLKQRCLRHCRSPSAFLRLHWRQGALVMGISHGLFCLGCCWALFSVMVAAAGMMSVAWMVVMTLVVFAEKVLPHGPRISVAVAVGLIALGLLVGNGTVQLANDATVLD
jgi:predicted metal-binding membrane protein